MSDFLFLFGVPGSAATQSLSQVEFGSAIGPRDPVHPTEVASGETQLVDLGQKTSMKELLLRTYADPTGTPPDLVIMARASDTDAWFAPGDTNGTFSSAGYGVSVGVGTAWSHTIAVANGTDQAFTVPCGAGKARMYLNGAAITAFTITGVRQVTFDVPPTAGAVITCYWPSEPQVIVKVNDIAYFADGTFQRITAITDATHMTATGGSGAGTHWTSYPAPNGEGEVRASLTGILDTMQFRVLAFPAATGGVTNFKILDAIPIHVPSGERQYREA